MNDGQTRDVVERLYEALEEDDVDAFIQLCAEGVEFRYPAEGLLSYGGTWRGRDEVRRFLERHDEAEGILTFEPSDITTQGTAVFVPGLFTGRARSTGREWSTRFVHALIVDRGELKAWEAFFDSAVAVEAHRSS